MIEPHFEPQCVQRLEPACRKIVCDLVEGVQKVQSIEIIGALALPFAARIQCAKFGWPASFQVPLLDWVLKYRAEAPRLDAKVLNSLRRDFYHLILPQLEWRRRSGLAAPADLTTTLIHQSAFGLQLDDSQICRVLSDWVAEEIATIETAIRITVEFLATNLAVQSELRQNFQSLPVATAEIIRLQGQLVRDRRTDPLSGALGGRRLVEWYGIAGGAGWPDGDIRDLGFSDADGSDADVRRLISRASIETCPRAALARMQLNVFLGEFLLAVEGFTLADGCDLDCGGYSSTGYAPLTIEICRDRLNSKVAAGYARSNRYPEGQKSKWTRLR
jgi:cytochrome P450